MDGGFEIKEQAPPVSVGQVVELEIIGVGRKGDGIARLNGYVIIIPNAIRGQKIKAEITQVLPKFGFGILLEVLDGQ